MDENADVKGGLPREKNAGDTENLCLTFQAAGESYALDVLDIQEVIQVPEITAVPNMPAYARGVLDLRGRIIPVCDLRLRLGLAETEVTERSCIIVIQPRNVSEGADAFGILVDSVADVVQINDDMREPPPDLGGDSKGSEMISAVAKIGDQVVMLLDAPRLV